MSGDSPSMLDFMVYPVMEKVVASSMKILDTLQDVVDLQKHANVAKWFQAMQDTPAYKATSVPMDKVAAFFDGYSQDKPDYDM